MAAYIRFLFFENDLPKFASTIPLKTFQNYEKILISVIALVAVLVFSPSCQKEDEKANSTSVTDENFVDLQTANKVGLIFSLEDSKSSTNRKNANITSKAIKKIDEFKGNNSKTSLYILIILKGAL